MTAPEGTKLIAEGGGYTIYEYDGYYVLRGLGQGKIDYVFEKDHWDLFSSVIRVADLIIQGETE